jgi:LemA protein
MSHPASSTVNPVRPTASWRARAVAMRRAALLLALPAVLGACGYNTIQTYDEAAAGAQRNIEVQLQRRADLIPNLVETVKGFAAQESAVLTQVTEARAGLQGALSRTGGADMGELATANAGLTAALGRLSVVVEAYPDLKSNENFLRLQDELTGTENRIAVSRTDYNGAVERYNAYIRKFPQVLTARVTGAQPREYFEADAAARTAPTVNFTK